MTETTTELATVIIASLALLVSLCALYLSFTFESAEGDRRDAEIETLQAQVLTDQQQAEVRDSVQLLLGQRLTTRTPAVDLYKFPIAEYYNATDFTQEQFLAEAEQQSKRFAESYLVVTRINWDAAVIDEHFALVTAEVQALRRLHGDDSSRTCHDSTGLQSQPLALQVSFERDDADSPLLIVGERSVPIGPILCVG